MDSFGESLEEQLVQQPDQGALSLVTAIASPDSQPHFDTFTQSEEFRRNLGRHYEKVMTMRHNTGARG